MSINHQSLTVRDEHTYNKMATGSTTKFSNLNHIVHIASTRTPALHALDSWVNERTAYMDEKARTREI